MTYGCNSAYTPQDGRPLPARGPRGRTTTSLMQDGWRVIRRGDILTREPVMVEVTTHWLTQHPDGRPLKCGRLQQAGMGADPKCAGCENEVTQ